MPEGKGIIRHRVEHNAFHAETPVELKAGRSVSVINFQTTSGNKYGAR